MLELIPLLRQAEILKRDSDYLRSKEERTASAWERLQIIKQTKLWPEFLDLDNWVTDAIKKRQFTDRTRFGRWQALQIGLTDPDYPLDARDNYNLVSPIKDIGGLWEKLSKTALSGWLLICSLTLGGNL